jgi:hypothetical protein
MKIILVDFNARVGRENIFKPTTRNGSLHQDSNGNGVGMVIFAAKNLVVKSTIFISAPGSLLIGRLTTRLITY